MVADLTLGFPLHLLDLLSSPWNLVLSLGQDICSGPFHLQPSTFLLSSLEPPPPSVVSSLDASGFLNKKLTIPRTEPHSLPHWARFQVLQRKIWAWHPTCCRHIWISVAFVLCLWARAPITLPKYPYFPFFLLLNPVHCRRICSCPTFFVCQTALDPTVVYFSEAVLPQTHSVQISIALPLLSHKSILALRAVAKLLTEAETRRAPHWYFSQPSVYHANYTSGSYL